MRKYKSIIKKQIIKSKISFLIMKIIEYVCILNKLYTLIIERHSQK